MKKMILLASLCVAAVSHAQLNKSYEISGKDMYGSGIALINQNTTRDMVFVSNGRNANVNSGYYCSLVKTDSNGMVLAAVKRDSTHAIERVTETHDNGILLASHFGHTMTITKFDASLNVLWANDLSLDATGYSPSFQGYIDIETVLDTNAPPGFQESYFIVFPSGSNDPAYQHDLNLNVAKIHEDGSVGWHYGYYEAVRQSTNTNYGYQDYARGITSFDTTANPNDRILAISGTRVTYDPFMSSYQFIVLIDENGMLMSDFQELTTADYEPNYGDIIWDGDSLAITYIEENGGFNSVDPSNATGMGLIKCDAGFNNFRGRYFWDDCENYGLSITMAQDNNYVIGGWVSYCQSHLSPFSQTLALLKVNRTSLNEEFYFRYNTMHDSYPSGFHRTDPNTDKHTLIGYRYHTNNAAATKIIQTDPFGETCGAEMFSMQTLDFTPVSNPLMYVEYPLMEQSPNMLQWNMVNILEVDCPLFGADGKFKGFATQETAAEPSIQLTHNLLNQSMNYAGCNVTFPMDVELELTVLNVAGQTVFAQTFAIPAGENSIEIPLQSLSNGMNFFRFAVNGEPLQVEKVMMVK